MSNINRPPPPPRPAVKRDIPEIRDVIFVFGINKPHDAYPKLPYHLVRHAIAVYEDGSRRELISRRHWCGSFPTRELALGEQMKREAYARSDAFRFEEAA